jgi:cytochrome c
MKALWLGIPLAILIGVAPGLGGQARVSLPPAELAKQTGCFECHGSGTDKPAVGPSYADIAARYKGDAKARERLIEIVKKGGKGNWTRISRGVPMPPYSPRLTDEEIARLVNWILESGKQ